MGSWNQTCGITNLHICHGDPIVVVPIVESHGHSRCYTNPFWTPMFMSFDAVYDDYGGGENCSGNGLPFVLEAIKRQLIECDVGENDVHDIAVKRDGFDEDLFFRACHENRLTVKTWHGDSKMQFMMIHRHALDYIFENWTWTHYCRSGGKYQDLIDDIPNLLADFRESVAECAAVIAKRGFLPSYLEYKGKWDGTLAQKWWAMIDGGHLRETTSLIRPYDMLDPSKSDAELTEIITEIFKIVWIDEFMNVTRKQWMPQAGAGSQQQDVKPYKVLVGATNSMIKRQSKK